jgi:hypothetical protein
MRLGTRPGGSDGLGQLGGRHAGEAAPAGKRARLLTGQQASTAFTSEGGQHPQADDERGQPHEEEDQCHEQ